MAKGMNMNKGSQQGTKTIVTIVPDREGQLGAAAVTMKYDPRTHRYDLRIGGELNVSCVNSATCLDRAESKGVIWAA